MIKEHADQLLGREMLDRDGDRIGEITQLFVDDRTEEPTWVTVKTGWFGMSQSFVPLNQVQVSGNQVRAAYDTASIKNAPRFAADQPLTPQDEEQLYAHYGLLDPSTQSRRPGSTDGIRAPIDDDSRAVPRADARGVTSRGRLRRYEAPGNPTEAGAADIGRARVCAVCGAYVAPSMLELHDTFHLSVPRPSGNFARHDVEVTEPATFGTATR